MVYVALDSLPRADPLSMVIPSEVFVGVMMLANIRRSKWKI